jgi:hypothetical protein
LEREVDYRAKIDAKLEQIKKTPEEEKKMAEVKQKIFDKFAQSCAPFEVE